MTKFATTSSSKKSLKITDWAEKKQRPKPNPHHGRKFEQKELRLKKEIVGGNVPTKCEKGYYQRHVSFVGDSQKLYFSRS